MGLFIFSTCQQAASARPPERTSHEPPCLISFSIYSDSCRNTLSISLFAHRSKPHSFPNLVSKNKLSISPSSLSASATALFSAKPLTSVTEKRSHAESQGQAPEREKHAKKRQRSDGQTARRRCKWRSRADTWPWCEWEDPSVEPPSVHRTSDQKLCFGRR